MKYHDTGRQASDEALAKWFEVTLKDGLKEIRLQSGYFGSRALAAISESLQISAASDLTTKILVGSNDSETLHSDIRRLVTRLGLPRKNASLGIVRFDNALFHPKVYHIRRPDDSQAAFIGSANFTLSGLTGRNVEAGISLDTAKGDSKELLCEIAEAIDGWFKPEEIRPGFHAVTNELDADALLAKGILATVRPSRPSPRRSNAASENSIAPARRRILISLPPLTPDLYSEAEAEDFDDDENNLLAEAEQEVIQDEISPPPTTAELEDTELPYITLPDFPDDFLFAPGATAETEGFEGLSGIKLPNQAIGLLIKLKKANARRFLYTKGTADINLPKAVAKTFRFGRGGDHGVPSTYMPLRVRYVIDNQEAEGQITLADFLRTRIAAIGYTATESGHKDFRMTMPARVNLLAPTISKQGLPLPTTGDYFIVEWPNENSDCFGLSFIGSGSKLEKEAEELFATQSASGQLVGGAGLVPEGFLPEWEDVMP